MFACYISSSRLRFPRFKSLARAMSTRSTCFRLVIGMHPAPAVSQTSAVFLTRPRFPEASNVFLQCIHDCRKHCFQTKTTPNLINPHAANDHGTGAAAVSTQRAIKRVRAPTDQDIPTPQHICLRVAPVYILVFVSPPVPPATFCRAALISLSNPWSRL